MASDLETKSYTVEIIHNPINGRIVSERWYNEFQQLERSGDLPADIEYCPESGTPIVQTWHDGSGNGPHRSGDNPAQVTTRAQSGIKVAECYRVMGKLHRDGDQPATIFRTDDGSLKKTSYWRHGKLHRDPKLGPAEITYDTESGQAQQGEYWFNGFRVVDAKLVNKPTI